MLNLARTTCGAFLRTLRTKNKLDAEGEISIHDLCLDQKGRANLRVRRTRVPLHCSFCSPGSSGSGTRVPLNRVSHYYLVVQRKKTQYYCQ